MRLSEHPTTKQDYRRARRLRNQASPIEVKLWIALRELAAIKNLKFRRQQPIHPYIADFACMKAKLLVEIDGDSHTGQETYDKDREEKLKRAGYFVMRFTNPEVLDNAEGVAELIVLQAERLIQNNKGT